jgi:hypothetical protein
VAHPTHPPTRSAEQPWPEEGDDFEYRQLVTAEFAKVMLAHGLHLKVQLLDAKEYFEWLGARDTVSV